MYVLILHTLLLINVQKKVIDLEKISQLKILMLKLLSNTTKSHEEVKCFFLCFMFTKECD
jgi:hypothetical protein